MDQLAEFLGIETSSLNRTVASIVVIAVLLLVRWGVLRWFRANIDDTEAQYRATKLSNYTTTVVIGISLLFIWIDALDSLSTYLGLVSAGIAIALGDLLKNMAAWGFIITRHPFRIGDRVEVRGLKGDVIDIRLFRFTVMEVGNWVEADESTGRMVHVPNGVVFTDTVANYTEGFSHIWDELPVLVTFESDWEKAEQLLREAITDSVPDVEAVAGERLRATAAEYRITIGALTPTVYLSVKESGVMLTARYLVEAVQRRNINARLWRAVLERYAAEPTVAFAYPTVRTYLEGPIKVSGPPLE